MRMTPGQKTPLAAIGVGTRFTVEVDHGSDDLDVVAFGLDAGKRIADDRYTVLFSNPSTPEGAITMRRSVGTASFDVDLDAMPPHVHRIMLVASHDTLPLSTARPCAVTIADASFDVGACLGAERAAMLVEIYRHAGDWRLAAVGQGFADGLVKLIEHLGGSVEDEVPTTRPTASMTSSGPTSARTEPTPRAMSEGARSTPPVNLQKITLQKKGSVDLVKRGEAFGDVVINLNWGGASRGGLFGGRKPLDLDLGCLYELRDGRRGVIQALGGAFGELHGPPYIALDGDDRSGSNAAGETMRIDGRHFDQIRRVGVFALIYDGAFRWSETDARASIRIPEQPEVVVEIRDGNDGQRLYGMAMIENVDGTMRVTNHARCYHDQRGFAEEIGIHLQWTLGRKN